MLTRIEIDGFKTFKDFKVELAPFQVIVGPNGSGKSNLFDALQLLSRLAEVNDLHLAFQASEDDPEKLRGDAHELFTILPDGKRTYEMSMIVEMLVDRQVRDEFGRVAQITYTRLRYEIKLQMRDEKQGPSRLRVVHESLKPITSEEDNWSKKYRLSSQNGWLPGFPGNRASFIGTFNARPPRETIIEPLTICIYADGNGNEREFLAEQVPRTVLSTINDPVYPHAFAARKEMLSWRFLHVSHESLHSSSSVNSRTFISMDGSNLPTALARLKNEDSFAFRGVSLDMATLVPGILDIEVNRDQIRNEYSIMAKTSDGRTYSAQVLSDGTLRLLTLATIRNDPQFHGLLCIEEPENGVDPLHLKNMARLLREMATDFNDAQQVNEPLRQILVTTHSPLFISQPYIIDSLLLAIMPTRVSINGSTSLKVTRMEHVITPNTSPAIEENPDRDRAVEVYTIDIVRKYLEGTSLEDARELLKKARTTVNER